jgi:hypothetical protein
LIDGKTTLDGLAVFLTVEGQMIGHCTILSPIKLGDLSLFPNRRLLQKQSETSALKPDGVSGISTSS